MTTEAVVNGSVGSRLFSGVLGEEVHFDEVDKYQVLPNVRRKPRVSVLPVEDMEYIIALCSNER